MKSINLKSFGRWLLPLGAVVAVITVAILTTSAPKPPALVRYIGPPLADGSRVTFLHPDSVGAVSVPLRKKIDRAWTVQYLQTTQHGDAGKSIFHRIPVLSQVWERVHPPEVLSENVVVSTIDGPKSSLAEIQDGRTESGFVAAGQTGPARVYGDNIDVISKKARLEYQFQYLHCGIPSRAVTKKYETVITNSFQVLPPGAKPPVP